jgi:SpoVK/Ycf46/Vps4 family AAA+-type ATPase
VRYEEGFFQFRQVLIFLRFEKQIDIPLPTKEMRETFIKKNFQGIMSNEELEKIVTTTDFCSFRDLEDVINKFRVIFFCYFFQLEKDVERIRT